MNLNFKKAFPGILFFLLLFFIFPQTGFGAVPDELRSQIDQKNKELEEINNKIREHQGNLEELQGQSRTLNNEIKQLNSTINQINLGIQSSQVTVTKLKLEIESLSYDIAGAEKEIALKREAIGELLREMQQREGEDLLVLFLKSKSLADGVLEAQSLMDLNSGLSVEIKNLESAKQNLAGKISETAKKKTATEIENQNLQNKKLILADTQKEKANILSQTKNQEKVYQTIISDLEKQQRAIGSEIDTIEEQLRLAFNPDILPSKSPNVLEYPLKNVYITQHYGESASARILYKSGFHNGMDFRASVGTPIYAAEDGKVFAVGNNGYVQYGRYIVIKHENNLATLYAHLSKQVVSAGDYVKRGDVIGYSGGARGAYGAGYSTAPHLHFGVYWAPSVKLDTSKTSPKAGLIPYGVTVNPEDYL
jgi:murein DD-endopeptidase MepM/ murein hydrolase activator NlpD